ncbi:cap-specific mRNA (nucleoside-2'-O-)-methyltransferase 1, partial [Clonorchis sinensis]
ALLRRKLQTPHDTLRPQKRHFSHCNTRIEEQFNRHHGATARSLSEVQRVLVRDYSGRCPKWIPGHILHRLGKALYEMQVGPASWIQHINKIRPTDARSLSTASSELSHEMLLDTFCLGTNAENPSAAPSGYFDENPCLEGSDRENGRRKYALMIFDVVCIYGQDCRHLPFTERLPFLPCKDAPNHVPMNVHPDGIAFQPHSLLLVRHLAEPWSEAVSRTSGHTYYFNRTTYESTFELPPNQQYPFKSTTSKRNSQLFQEFAMYRPVPKHVKCHVYMRVSCGQKLNDSEDQAFNNKTSSFVGIKVHVKRYFLRLLITLHGVVVLRNTPDQPGERYESNVLVEVSRSA